MKNKVIASIAALLLASISGAKAASTLSAWTFDNVAVGINSSPSPSNTLTGPGIASALGMANTYNNTNSVSNPDVQSLAGSSTGTAGPNGWRIRSYSTTPGNRGNGWSTNAPIGTQGAQFTGSTFGYHQIVVSFDVNATADAEANLQVQYTMNGSNWVNATITSAGSSGGTIQNNTSSANTVFGSYVQLVSGWNNQITADLTGLAAVDNDKNFAIRLVNASTGPDCVDTTGAVYNNTSGNWTFDNVAIQGTSIDYVADWVFDSVGTLTGPTNTFPAIIGSGSATQLGMSNNYTYNGGEGPGSIASCDVLASAGASTGSGAYAWRIRGPSNSSGGGPGQANGWNTQAPIGTQGAEFDADTSGFTNIICTFDIDSTSAAEGKLCVLYTTDGWVTSNVAQSIYYQPVVSFNHTNSSSSLTVAGNYIFFLAGGIWYNNIVVDFSGVPGVANNPSFGIRIVNAATGADCLNATGGGYNNSSGNWRYDNVVIGGTSGNPAPAIAPDPNASVDGPFTNTFSDNATWRSKIYAVSVNGAALTNTAYTISAGQIVFTPSKSPLLQTSGLLNIAISATGFGTARYSQSLAAGVATTLAVTTQAAGPTASGGTLVANPSFLVSDQYGNGTTNPYANVSVTASVGGSGGWTLGGDTIQTNIGGVIAFTNLTATLNGSAAISNAVITFTISGYPGNATTNSPAFNIGVAPVNFSPGNLAVLQLDANANNTTFSVIELKPSATGQTAPLNIVPISATGTNALRESSSGSCGKLSLSDDGTLTCFAAFADGSAATPDETLNLNRTGSGVYYNGQLTNAINYVSTSLGGSQARSAVSFASGYWFVDDKGGLYDGNAGDPLITSPNGNPYNNVVVRVFGGVPWIETQKVNGLGLPVLYSITQSIDDGTWTINHANNLPSDGNASDFYMISTNGGTSYDILYVLDGASTNAIITKYSNEGGIWYESLNWVANGSFTNATGGDSLFATTNGTGGIYLYLTTGVSKSNSLVRVTDAGGWGGPIHIVSSNVLYTAKGGTYLKGITFVPQQTAYAGQLIPPPILTAQNTASVGSTFSITNTPDDGFWRSNITAITVNGSLLPTASYSTNQVGKIVFDPSLSGGLLTTNGSETIMISATGYSTDSIVQTLSSGTASQLAVTTQPTAPSADGGALAAQPVVKVEDLYGNVVTNSSASITAAAGQAAWTLGGTTTKSAVSGMASFTGLTAFSTNSVTGATIHFTSGGLTAVDSTPGFNIAAPIQSVLGGVMLNGGQLTFTFTNAPGLSFSVLATNDISAPLTNWPVIGTAVENPAGSGNYQFTNSSATNAQEFYILRQP
jgi:hypothetical protein